MLPLYLLYKCEVGAHYNQVVRAHLLQHGHLTGTYTNIPVQKETDPSLRPDLHNVLNIG